ncbi:methyltransferase [Kribbella italica]|uniref:Methylase of polypeptide subunit release factors n=1 Tax=Kribbella italica TaxID=1540520 RepID=A0A7W9J919_9ACTN|nr:class I SAM-dependent methyltransferase [Kribbella italica]MBB5837831.1 methylase of polypeptide subunit release factors [Kribbella italica]
MNTLLVIDDAWSASRVLRAIDQGSHLLWQGDWHNGRQVIAAIKRRLRPGGSDFETYRRQRARQVQAVNAVLVPLDSTYSIGARRAPDVHQACLQAYGEPSTDRLVPLQELLGVIGAHQLRRRGVFIPALDARIHPYYGVFAPTRSEYVDLVADAPLPGRTAFDIGTGTGVLAAVIARRGLAVTATDISPSAVVCARDNLARLGLPVEVLRADLFPPGRADLIVCNPPWIPARPITTLDHAVYDEDGELLSRFLLGARKHLQPRGEIWLILSDLAEHLGLRSRADLPELIGRAGLEIAGGADVVPAQPRAQAARRGLSDPLADARAKEVTTLWRLVGT